MKRFTAAFLLFAVAGCGPHDSGTEASRLSTERLANLIVRQTEEEWRIQRSTPLNIKDPVVVEMKSVAPDKATLHAPITRFIPLSGIEKIYLPFQSRPVPGLYAPISDAQVMHILQHAIVITKDQLGGYNLHSIVQIHWTDGRCVVLEVHDNHKEGWLVLPTGAMYCFQVPTTNAEQGHED